MKSIKIAFSVLSLGLLLTVASCNSNKSGEDTSMDSAGMDNTQTEMGTDTMSTDSMSGDSSARPL